MAHQGETCRALRLAPWRNMALALKNILVTSCFVLYCRKNVENTYAMIDTLNLNKMQALLFEDKLNQNKIIQKENPKTKSQM